MDYSEMIQKFSWPQDYVDLPIEHFEQLDEVISIPTEVCHYTSKEKALEKILKNKNIRLGNITSTNDPKESKQRWLVYFNREFFSSEAGPCNEEEQTILKEWKIFCTCCHNNPSSEFIKDNPKQEIEHSQYGVARPSMWAHYAGNHSGVCIVFDGKKLDENIRNELKDKQTEIFHGFVRYDYEKSTSWIKVIPSEGSTHKKIDEIRSSMIKNYDENFLYKSPDWKSEREFRWLIQSQDTSEIFVSIENAIKAVIVGVDFDEVYEPSLKILCEQLGIPAGRIRWENGVPYARRDSIYKPITA
ncbi:MAG: DUF2971 domain-containing protein [Anaerolineales bacterium]